MNRPATTNLDDTALRLALAALDETSSQADLDNVVAHAATWASVTPEYLVFAGPRGRLSSPRQRRAWLLVADLCDIAPNTPTTVGECSVAPPEDVTS